MMPYHRLPRVSGYGRSLSVDGTRRHSDGLNWAVTSANSCTNTTSVECVIELQFKAKEPTVCRQKYSAESEGKPKYKTLGCCDDYGRVEVNPLLA